MHPRIPQNEMSQRGMLEKETHDLIAQLREEREGNMQRIVRLYSYSVDLTESYFTPLFVVAHAFKGR